MTETTGLLGRDISGLLPEAAPVPVLTGRDARIWELAKARLRVRDNDVHTLYSHGLAQALVPLVPGARPEIVLPAILLHDTGWSRVPEDLILEAIAPRPRHPGLVRVHELEGALIARNVLDEVGLPPEDVEEIVAIVDGHDSRPHALGPSDAAVKDADKLWRLTPHGLAAVGRWFGLDAERTLRLVGSRTLGHLHTDAGRAMGAALAAIAATDLAPQRRALAPSDPEGGP